MQTQTSQQTAEASPSELAARQDAGPTKISRRIVQIATSAGLPEAIVYALCDDGTLWHNYGPDDWYQLPAIP
ncbi:hypothetical protein [Acetobacter cerevisiae]|uniref:hypothetical protein n=1 Tax=Acetobacter cerevisiae TaxID=178900 RepID=UPI00209CCD53|nr:hypothetical protein [Acetobacter cerevisiae]MCP1271237.1 hypothetical protein [Acetobacter cerevisiae]MCP1279191.1 hypothetical protein [Acetobacter cerevisiae]